MNAEYDFNTYSFCGDKIFKVPCGRHIREQAFIWSPCGGSLYYGGSEYSFEKGNPAIHVNDLIDECRKCKKIIFNGHGHRHNMTACEGKLTDEPFSFENSLNKIYMDYDISFVKERNEKYPDWRCPCIQQDRGRVKVLYSLDFCMSYGHNGCNKKVCIITKKERNLELVNIFGDVKYVTDKGMLTEHETVVKGIKIISHPIYKELADRQVKELQKMSEEMWGYTHRSCSTIKPFRFYVQKKAGRDLMSDLQDIKDGIEVIHDSDIKAKEKAAKQAMTQERKSPENKAKKLIKLFGIDTLIEIVDQFNKYADVESISEEFGVPTSYIDKIVDIGYKVDLKSFKQAPSPKANIEQMTMF